MKKCPYCAEEIQDEAIICRFCGKELGPVQSTITPVTTSSEIKPKRGIGIFIIFALILLIAAGSAWFYFYGPCGVKKVNAAYEDIQNNLGKWDDANRIANSTGRISLSGPITNLTTIKQDIDNLSVPTCMQSAKDQMVQASDLSIQGYVAFMEEASDASVSSFFDQSGSMFETAITEIGRIKGCAPFCNKDNQ